MIRIMAQGFGAWDYTTELTIKIQGCYKMPDKKKHEKHTDISLIYH